MVNASRDRIMFFLFKAFLDKIQIEYWGILCGRGGMIFGVSKFRRKQ